MLPENILYIFTKTIFGIDKTLFCLNILYIKKFCVYTKVRRNISLKTTYLKKTNLQIDEFSSSLRGFKNIELVKVGDL